MTLMARPYGGTGLSLGELQDLPRRDRLAILAGTVALRRTELDELKRQGAAPAPAGSGRVS